MTWKPISTAPCEGGEILVWSDGDQRMRVVRWWSMSQLKWWGFEDGEDENGKPTHWSPLPDPPGEVADVATD
jgi:hypothetical protein